MNSELALDNLLELAYVELCPTIGTFVDQPLMPVLVVLCRLG